MKNISTFAVITLALALGACGHYSDDMAALDGAMKSKNTTVAAYTQPQDIQPAAGIAAPLNDYLARDYYEMARYENDKAFDYKAAKMYTQKALTASKGTIVVPSKVSNFDVTEEQAAELNKARSELIAALKEQKSPENQQALAKAQTSFDCWLERAEEAVDEAHYAECKGTFEQSIASLMMPAAGVAATAMPQAYNVEFAQNSNIPDPASANTIEYIAQFLKAPENASYTASLTGFATTQGEFATNLVNARVAAVRDALVAKGVTEAKLKPFISSPATAMPAGVENRKVEVTLIAPQPEFVPVTPVQVQ